SRRSLSYELFLRATGAHLAANLTAAGLAGAREPAVVPLYAGRSGDRVGRRGRDAHGDLFHRAPAVRLAREARRRARAGGMEAHRARPGLIAGEPVLTRRSSASPRITTIRRPPSSSMACRSRPCRRSGSRAGITTPASPWAQSSGA